MAIPFPKGLATASGQKATDSSYGFLRKSDDSAWLTTWTDATATIVPQVVISANPGGATFDALYLSGMVDLTTNPRITAGVGASPRACIDFGSFGGTPVTQIIDLVNNKSMISFSGSATTPTVAWQDGTIIASTTSTGVKYGGATSQKQGWFNATPIVRPSAWTQTYVTASKTVANLTSSALTGAFGSTGTAIADVGTSFNQTTLNNNFRVLEDAYNALRNDLIVNKNNITSLIDDQQALGFAG